MDTKVTESLPPREIPELSALYSYLWYRSRDGHTINPEQRGLFYKAEGGLNVTLTGILHTLPKEIIGMIMLYLSPRDLVSLSSVCWKLRRWGQHVEIRQTEILVEHGVKLTHLMDAYDSKLSTRRKHCQQKLSNQQAMDILYPSLLFLKDLLQFSQDFGFAFTRLARSYVVPFRFGYMDEEEKLIYRKSTQLFGQMMYLAVWFDHVKSRHIELTNDVAYFLRVRGRSRSADNPYVDMDLETVINIRRALGESGMLLQCIKKACVSKLSYIKPERVAIYREEVDAKTTVPADVKFPSDEQQLKPLLRLLACLANYCALLVRTHRMTKKDEQKAKFAAAKAEAEAEAEAKSQASSGGGLFSSFSSIASSIPESSVPNSSVSTPSVSSVAPSSTAPGHHRTLSFHTPFPNLFKSVLIKRSYDFPFLPPCEDELRDCTCAHPYAVVLAFCLCLYDHLDHAKVNTPWKAKGKVKHGLLAPRSRSVGAKLKRALRRMRTEGEAHSSLFLDAARPNQVAHKLYDTTACITELLFAPYKKQPKKVVADEVDPEYKVLGVDPEEEEGHEEEEEEKEVEEDTRKPPTVLEGLPLDDFLMHSSWTTGDHFETLYREIFHSLGLYSVAVRRDDYT